MTRKHDLAAEILTLSCKSTLPEVRAMLLGVDAFLRAKGAPSDWVEDMNIILGEVLSNIARHGYPDRPGRIDLEVRLDACEVRCRICDSGTFFDPTRIGHRAPDPESLSEGGYGWFLIRSLTRALTYRRVLQMNCLTFWVPVGNQLPKVELVEH